MDRNSSRHRCLLHAPMLKELMWFLTTCAVSSVRVKNHVCCFCRGVYAGPDLARSHSGQHMLQVLYMNTVHITDARCWGESWSLAEYMLSSMAVCLPWPASGMGTCS
jgi:hypothetical protein